MNGMETMRRLKAIPHLSGTPVVMITGKNEEEIVVECINAGAVDFVVKPFVHATLIDKIDRALHSTIIFNAHYRSTAEDSSECSAGMFHTLDCQALHNQ